MQLGKYGHTENYEMHDGFFYNTRRYWKDGGF